MSRLILCILAAAALATSITSAETIIPGGNVSGLWNAAGSPYLIQGTITIPANETLIVDPGVSVIFQGNYGWIVQGWLEAIGTATDSILITAQDTTARWYGIKFDDAPDSSYLEYCVIEYARANQINTGGAVHCLDSNPVICHCTFRYNLGTGGGAIYLSGSYARIMYNNFIRNGLETVTYWGGGIAVASGSPAIAYNDFLENRCSNAGAGLCVNKGASAQVFGNNFIGNERTGAIYADAGGGLSTWDGLLLNGNVFAENSDGEYGGGMRGSYSHVNKTVVYGNVAGSFGGGLSNFNGSTVSNSIIWSNVPDQISSSFVQVTYSDVQDGWPGIGNLNSEPMFIAPEYYDFRLQWGSPCIDSGDPDPANNDPDGTRGDIGPFYYDQSVPVRVLMTPHERSIVVPPQGGSFDYTLWLTNIDPSNPELTFWMDITLPDGSVFGPLLGPLTAQLDSGVTDSRERTQLVPARASEGVYSFNAYAVVGIDTSRDSFSFFKMEPAQAGGISDWKNTGESLENLGATHLTTSLPLDCSLEQNYPNPFNPITAISYQLSANSHVSLRIYDTAGRLVTTLFNGWRQAGSHQVTWDASGLPSGLYFCRMQAGEFRDVRKMMLVK